MDDWIIWIQGIAAAIAILTAIISVVIYFTRLKLKTELLNQKQEFDTELAAKRSTIFALESSNQSLNQSLQLVRAGKENAVNLLAELDGLLEETRNLTRATADSILIKNPYVEDTLIFLRIHGTAADKIKRMMTPIAGSQAGSVFVKGEISYFHKSNKTSVQHYKKPDTRSGYKTKSILSIPLKDSGRSLAVLQMLNKKNSEYFDEKDFIKIESLCADITKTVNLLIKDPTSLKSLGIIEKTDSVDATIIFSDITNFSSSFENLPNRQVTEIVNEYFDRLCDICLRNGGSIDKFLGDGFLIRFNIPRMLKNYVDASIHSALMMQKEFSCLKKEWDRIGLPIDRISNRIGIATGPVIGGLMGHSQHLSFTVMGNTVNLSSKLCEMAHISHSGIMVCKNTVKRSSETMQDAIKTKKYEQNGIYGYEIIKDKDIRFNRRKTDR